MQKYKNGPLSLCQLSKIEISKRLWNQPTWRHLILSMNADNIWSFTTEGEGSRDLLRAKICHRIGQFILPGAIKKELLFVVVSMGTRLLDWVRQMERRGSHSVDLALYLDHLYWTDAGSTNTSATLESMYFSGALAYDFLTWIELCKHCLQNCILDFWPKVTKIEEFTELGLDSVMSIYWCYSIQNRLDEIETFRASISDYNDNHSLEQNMFEYAFTDATYSATKFFWRLLSDHQRKCSIISISNKLIKKPKLLPETDAINFLFQQLFFYELDTLWFQLLQLKHIVFELLKWPCQDLFMMALEESCLHGKNINHTLIVHEIVRTIESSILPAAVNSRYRKMFITVWEKITTGNNSRDGILTVLKNLWDLQSIELLNFVINDAHVKALRPFNILYKGTFL